MAARNSASAGPCTGGGSTSVSVWTRRGWSTASWSATAALREAAEAHRSEVDAQIARSPENTAVVAALEQQFDQFTAAREGSDLLSEIGEVPSGEEIGAELERFLADQERRRGD